MTMYEDVTQFHRVFGAYIGQTPSVPPPEVCKLRQELIKEEFRELMEAVEKQELAQIAAESVDLIYVILGGLIAYGVDIAPIWAAIHAANMAKVGGPRLPSGKIGKPIGWMKPDIAMLIAEQSRSPELDPL